MIREEEAVVAHNREAWNREARAGEIWSQPVDTATIARARTGDFAVILTPTEPVPRDWLGTLEDAALLGLASGGGQQSKGMDTHRARISLQRLQHLATARLLLTGAALEHGVPERLCCRSRSAGFYHCMSRCVRRGWLCGQDPISGRCFDHRRDWIEQRLLMLADSFAVGLYAWAGMSNHTHVVLRIDPGLHEQWMDEEVARRWARLDRTLAVVPESHVEQRFRGVLKRRQKQQGHAEAVENQPDVSAEVRWLLDHGLVVNRNDNGVVSRFLRQRLAQCAALLTDR